ncbi:MAG: DoxX family membrane protein [Deltaproteobacteria bacterium]|nr:DoxX family membrane protein [Deltaproteobacteria bacterium]MBW2042892.1 DoxX family membrane protein [Deltaproteobacteria bacterium]MBW2133481.1 DoxX family membrane protein [Deltaproteobacteria bacterium]
MEEKKSSKTGRVVFHALRIFLGAVFLYASYDKILHPETFAQAVYNYQILPDAAVNFVSLVLPWLELLLGLCLVFNFWLPGAVLTGTVLLAIFMGALVFNQIRGLDIHCGCFSTSTEEGPADVWTVARDLAFFLIAVYLAVSVFFIRPGGVHRSDSKGAGSSAE